MITKLLHILTAFVLTNREDNKLESEIEQLFY